MPSVPPSPSLYHTLLRPPIIQILRAAGFHAARPTVVDTLTDLAARYLLLLASSTAAHIELSHPGTPQPTLSDILYALREAGALRPQLSDCEEWMKGEEDMRGVEGLVAWMTGENVGGGVGEIGMGREIRRVAGFVSAKESKGISGPAAGTTTTGAAAASSGGGAGGAGSGATAGASAGAPTAATIDDTDVDVDVLEKEDYLTSLKKKHSKTGEESRYQGTAIGKDAEPRRITVEGAGEGGPRTIKQWVRQTRKRSREEDAKIARKRRERERIEQERMERERIERERAEREREEQRKASNPGINGSASGSGSGSSGLSSVRSSVEMDDEVVNEAEEVSQMSVDG